MPSEALLESLKTERLWERRGQLWARRSTPGARRWRRLITAPGMPRLPPDLTVVLTGRANRDLLDIAIFEPRTREGRDLYCIVLDDPHPREVQAWSEQARSHLGALLPARQLRRAWDALWQECFLHELGHVRYARRHGWGGRELPSEEAAEAYAWRVLQRLHPRTTCLTAWGLSYLADAS
jgi:hypothetical protein